MAKVLTLKAENQSLRQELSAMDPKFFEEVEDLKYAYQQVRVIASVSSWACVGLYVIAMPFLVIFRKLVCKCIEILT